MTFTGIGVVPRVHCIPSTEHVALAGFSGCKAGRSLQPTKCEAGRINEQLPACSRTELSTLPDKSWLVRASQNVTVTPRCRQIIVGALETGRDQELPPLIYIEPTHIPILGVVPARGLSRVETRVNERPRKMSHDFLDISSARNKCALVTVENFSEEELVIPKTTVYGVVQTSESLTDKFSTTSERSSDSPARLTYLLTYSMEQGPS